MQSGEKQAVRKRKTKYNDVARNKDYLVLRNSNKLDFCEANCGENTVTEVWLVS